MHLLWFQAMKSDTTCLVLDLDDTLYPEYLYQKSGFEAVEELIFNLYGVKLNTPLVELSKKSPDVFSALCETLDLPQKVKSELIYIYRYHVPKISLDFSVSSFLDKARSQFANIAIITDGRSVTQRMKLRQLGILDIPVFISEEWNSEKPDEERFSYIQKKYSNCENFCYIGDNPAKDFIAPNKLKWFSIGVRDKGFNIHSQDCHSLPCVNHPKVWVNELSEVFFFFD